MSAHAMNAEHEMLGESLRKPFVSSVALHVGLVGGLALYAWWNGSGETLGDPHAGGASVGITTVTSIPLPSRGPENPVAADTKSTAPQEVPEKQAPKAKEPDPDEAIAILKSKQPPPITAAAPKFKPFNEIAPNQATVKAAQAASAPIFTQAPGAGQIDTGENTTLGKLFPGYASVVRDRVAREWTRTTRDVDASLKTAPTVIASFEILRDGNIRNIRIIQSSRITSLDNSVRRAIEDVGRFAPIPVEYEGNSISVEFEFKLKR